jgi:hypothetical protein
VPWQIPVKWLLQLETVPETAQDGQIDFFFQRILSSVLVSFP